MEYWIEKYKETARLMGWGTLVESGKVRVESEKPKCKNWQTITSKKIN